MKSTPSREEALFSDALALPSAERGAFLAKACGANVELLARLVALVAAHEGPESLMDSAAAARTEFAVMPDEAMGAAIGRYKLLEKLGEGGCGAVWAAEQREPVKRRVALKIIKLGMDTRQVIARFEAERQALAMMDHPNIAKMLDAGATDTGRPYFVMELVRGIPITTYCDENNLTTTQRLDLAIKVCHAIQHAHQKGIIHRDIKPSNILITLHDGTPVPKVIDFGIAKATQQELTDKTIYTKFQQFIGTPAYMSPEQAEMSGLDIDTRSDVYSLGVLIYELVTGRTPFDSKELLQQGVDELRRTIKEKEPPRPSTRIETMQGDDLTTAARRRSTDPRKLAASIKGDLDWIVMKCLEKDRTRRYDTANGIAMDVQRYLADEPVVARPPSTFYRVRKFVRRHQVAVTAAVAILGVVVVGSIVTASQAVRALRAERMQNELRQATERAQANEASARRVAEAEQLRAAKIRWARETALPEINRLIKKDDISAAFALARQAEEHIANDPALVNVWPMIASTWTIETTPAGADLYVKPYKKPDAEWEKVGQSPRKDLRISRETHRWRITKPGYVPLEVSDNAFWSMETNTLKCQLETEGSSPDRMVRIPADWNDPPSPLGDYWLDKFEVSNRDFKAFVDQGGYTTEKSWKNPFVKDGVALGWAEAMKLFRDSTGAPGPATWSNSNYANGEAEYPVTGVSWFEAAAYAEFAGKRLPSISHWRRANAPTEAESIVPFSNFGGRGLAPVGHFTGVNISGALDMAGNAKEWCWNEADHGKRYILGGGWDEPEYMFHNSDALSPFDRSPHNGFRCIKLIGSNPLPNYVDEPVAIVRRDFALERPVSEEKFQEFKPLFAYDQAKLDARVSAAVESNGRWQKDKVSFNAAYNGERLDAYVFLPRQARPPYQVVVYFPGAGAQSRFGRSSDNLTDMGMIETIIATHRAVIYPIYKGSYERKAPVGGLTSVANRDNQVQRVKDVRRAIDYLETRGDIDVNKLAFFGYSWGTGVGLLVSALDERIKVNVFAGGGFTDQQAPRPEIDSFNFAPRIKIPTLMINGRNDFGSPVETAQKPLFRALGTPPEHKKLLLVDAGHGISLNPVASDILEWFDRYLAPVK